MQAYVGTFIAICVTEKNWVGVIVKLSDNKFLGFC